MDRLYAIKIRQSDGTYGAAIPINVLAENVDWNDSLTLIDILGQVDTSETIQDQINNLKNSKASQATVNALDQKVDNAVEYITHNSEVANARVGADDTSYSNLKERLDGEYNKLQNQIGLLGTDVDGDIAEIQADVSNIKNAFIDGVDVTRADYTSTYTGRSRVYYAIIPAENRPKLAMAGNPGAVQYPEYFLPDITPTIMVNASTFNTGTGIPDGLVLNDGEIIQENNLYGQTTAAEDHYILYMDADGNLQSVSAVDHTATQIKNAGAQWAIVAWDPIVMNGQYVSGHTDTDAQPRTVIGQDAGGRYLVMVCDGRLYESRGMSFIDIYNFVQSIGFSPRILYNLDGGQSSAFYSAGVRMNSYNGGTRRAIPNTLYFASGDNSALMITQKNRDIAKYWAEESIPGFYPSFYGINIFNFIFNNIGINGIRAIQKTLGGTGQYEFTDMFKLAHEESTNRVYLEGLTDTYRSLIDFLPSNVLKIFGQEIFQWRTAGTDAIERTTDLKTCVKSGFYYISNAHPDNPTGQDGYVVVFAYGEARYQIIVALNHICGRNVDPDGTYATSWVDYYTPVTQASISINTESGLSGTLYVTRNMHTVMVAGDVTVGTPVANAVIASGFPHPMGTVASLMMCSNNNNLRILLDTSGNLKFGFSVTPASGSLSEYARISFTYLTA